MPCAMEIEQDMKKINVCTEEAQKRTISEEQTPCRQGRDPYEF